MSIRSISEGEWLGAGWHALPAGFVFEICGVIGAADDTTTCCSIVEVPPACIADTLPCRCREVRAIPCGGLAHPVEHYLASQGAAGAVIFGVAGAGGTAAVALKLVDNHLSNAQIVGADAWPIVVQIKGQGIGGMVPPTVDYLHDVQHISQA